MGFFFLFVLFFQLENYVFTVAYAGKAAVPQEFEWVRRLGA